MISPLHCGQPVLLAGACLTLEFAARNVRRYGGVVELSGTLIGPDSTPVFLGCSEMDFHVPKECVDENADIMRTLSSDVTERLYPQMDHTINQAEIDFIRSMLDNVS